MTQFHADRRLVLAGAASLATLAAAPLVSAQTTSPAKASTFTPQALPFDPKTIAGLSEKLLVSHHDNNYVGAVKRLAAIDAQLAALDPSAAPTFQLNGLKREELIAWNSMILHELYFAGLGAPSKPGQPGGGDRAGLWQRGPLARRIRRHGQGARRRIGVGVADLERSGQASGQYLGRRPHHDPGRRHAASGPRHV